MPGGVMSITVNKHDNRLTISNGTFSLTIETGRRLSPQLLRTRTRKWADRDYIYRIVLPGGQCFEQLRPVNCEHHRDAHGNYHLTLIGRMGNTNLELRHELLLPTRRRWFEERLTIRNWGRSTIRLKDLQMGFCKGLFKDAATNNWADNLDELFLLPLPFRRFWGPRIDRLRDGYGVAELARDKTRPLPDFGSEGWFWGNENSGLLMIKYAPQHIEFSCVGPEAAPDAAEAVRFGGAALYRGDPEQATILRPGQQFGFGKTRYYSTTGGYQQATEIFKSFMVEHGHDLPAEYNPRLHWNVLYNCPWRMDGPDIKPYSLTQLRREAQLAKAVGCEALYLDPTWDRSEGSNIWDQQRLGPFGQFVRTCRDEYGLEVALHVMVNAADREEFSDCWRKDPQGNYCTWQNKLFMPCTYLKQWQQEKTRRLSALAEQGAYFMMIDFTDFPPGTACCDGSHGHELPSFRQTHADGIINVIRALRRNHPRLLIEAHDRISSGMQDYCPLYYQHGKDSFDENWAFEFMWNPLNDILTGRAVGTLYDYNRCHRIPLYVHINLAGDNDRLLAFWWYASTCRHMGVGGLKDPGGKRFKLAAAAIRRYRRLKRFFTHGRFVGLSETLHLHALPQQQAAVLCAFNLTSRPRKLAAKLEPAMLGADAARLNVKGADLRRRGGRLMLTIPVRPLSPAIVEISSNTASRRSRT